MSTVAETEVAIEKFSPLQILEPSDGRNRAHRTADGTGHMPAEMPNFFLKVKYGELREHY